MEKYCAEHPEYQPRVVKTFLSKAEQRIKDKVDGKPEKPPRYFPNTQLENASGLIAYLFDYSYSNTDSYSSNLNTVKL